jgi:uncharacterized protein
MDQPVPSPAPPTPPAPTYSVPAPLSQGDEHTWAAIAHFSILLNIFTGFVGTLGALVIYLGLRDRSRYVGYQALQALVFQLIAWIVAGLIAITLWTLGGILSVVCIGILLFPLALLFSLLPIAALVYGVIGGLQTYEGRDFQYWLVGEWVRSALVGSTHVQ